MCSFSLSLGGSSCFFTLKLTSDMLPHKHQCALCDYKVSFGHVVYIYLWQLFNGPFRLTSALIRGRCSCVRLLLTFSAAPSTPSVSLQCPLLTEETLCQGHMVTVTRWKCAPATSTQIEVGDKENKNMVMSAGRLSLNPKRFISLSLSVRIYALWCHKELLQK